MEERLRGLPSREPLVGAAPSGRGPGRGEGEAIRADGGVFHGGSVVGICGSVSTSRCFYV